MKAHVAQPSSSTTDPLPVAVIGCGRMGRLHARVYSEMPQVKLIGVHDADSDVAAAVAEEFSCESFASLDAMLPGVHAVTVAVPTRFHVGVAEQCLRRGIGCLIEKPLAKDAP